MVSQPNKSFSIEELASIIALLDEERMPILETYPTEHVPDRVIYRFNMVSAAVFTSIVMVASFCHSLLLANRTTTTREVYYVTHFRSQRNAIWPLWMQLHSCKSPSQPGSQSVTSWMVRWRYSARTKGGDIILDGRALRPGLACFQ
jgi:hypothetical protein